MPNPLLLLYGLAFYGLVHMFMKVKADASRGAINWTAWEAVGVTLAIYFGSQLVGGLALYGYGLARGWDTNYLTKWAEQSVFAQFVFILIVEGLVIWLLRKFLARRQSSFKTIGLKKPKLNDIGWALIGFGMYFGVYIVVLQIVGQLVPSINLDQQQDIGFSGAYGGSLALVFISLVILPPLVEEILIRGFLYTSLKKHLPKIWAVLVTSGLFAVAHLQAGGNAPLLWVAAVDTFVLSLVLIYLREKTGGLWASIGLHTIKNGIAFLALFVFTR